MSILIGAETRVLVQGITGKQGSTATREMGAYGTKIVCGVTPGKGGQLIEGIPVYNSIKEALRNHDVDASVVYVPPLLAKAAILEAVDSGISLIVIITEGVPLHDTAICFAAARERGVRIIGPGSVGIISPGKAKIGSVGGFDRAFRPGSIGIISKSGGMASETALLLSQAGFGQSTAVSTGGELLLGTSFADVLGMFEHDHETTAVVLFGEVGGTYEQAAADLVAARKFTKPLIAFISGKFVSSIHNVALGHAGALIEGETGTQAYKANYLRARGIAVADVHHDIISLVRQALTPHGMENKHQ